MSAAGLLALASAGSGVFGAWDVLSGVEHARMAERFRRVLAPVGAAAAEGRSASQAEQRRLTALAATGLLAAGWLVAGLVVGVLAAAGGPSLVAGILRSRRRRYEAAVRAGAAGSARAIAAALTAGRSIRGAVADAATEVTGPAGHELRLAADALAVGAPTEPVLERLRARAGGGPWDTVVAALLLQRDAGGDLAGLLRGLAGSLESAARAERDARAATAQSRMTAWIVAALPALAAVLAELGSPGFLAGLLAEPISAVLTTLAFMLQAAAVLWIRRIAR